MCSFNIMTLTNVHIVFLKLTKCDSLANLELKVSYKKTWEFSIKANMGCHCLCNESLCFNYYPRENIDINVLPYGKGVLKTWINVSEGKAG